MPRRVIQVFMGVALLLAAGFLRDDQPRRHPRRPVRRLGLAGLAVRLWQPWQISSSGALMCVGIGNYAPSMALLGIPSECTRSAAYPIMIASDGVLIPVASLRSSCASGRFATRGCGRAHARRNRRHDRRFSARLKCSAITLR